MTWRHEVYRYGDLAETEEFQARARLTIEEVRSLRAHPYARPSDPAGLLLRRGDVTVGAIRLITGRVRIGASEHRIAWTSTWEFTGEREDSPGAALLIARALQEAGSVAACGVATRARQILSRLRFDEVALPRWILVVRTRPFFTRRGAALPLLAPAGDAALRVLRACRRTSRTQGLALHVVKTFDARVDAVDEAQRGPLWFPRNHLELNWAIRHPWSTDASYLYRAYQLSAGDQLVAFALARERTIDGVRVGSILRCGARTADAGRELVAAVSSALIAAGVDMVELCSTRAWVNDAARACGMLRRGRIEIMARLSGEAAVALQAEGNSLADADADLGEGDIMFF